MPGASDILYARVMGWTKIVLPLAALAILSSLFLFSKSHAPVEGIPTFTGDLDEFVSKERITGPKFSGMTASGISLQISAAEASPQEIGGSAFGATDLIALVETPAGGRIDVRATLGVINSTTMTAELTEGIVLVTSSGYRATTHGLTFAMDRLDIRSQGAIVATGPLGEIQAGGMQILGAETTDSGEVAGFSMMFKNGTKLIYRPQ
jgi:lipopolysaccharide export system protein LptC